MAKTFLVNLDLAQNQLLNAVLQNLATAPASPVEGQIYYNTAAHRLEIRTNLAWVPLLTSAVNSLTVDNSTLENIGTATDPNLRVKALGLTNSHISASAAIALSKLAVDPLARANHTGTQLAATISDFDTQVRTNRLDQMAAPATTLDLAGHRITGLSTPTSGTDGTTKDYVDSVAAGLRDFKESVRVATTANITLSGEQTIDGVNVVTGDRVLVKNQSTASANGIYVVAVGAWSRAADADTSAEVSAGMYVVSTEGATNADIAWVLATPDPITLGTTSLTFTQFGGGTAYSAGAGLTLSGAVFDVGAGTGIQVNADSVQISPTYAGQTSITTLGTITTGVWNGTAVPIANGGTGATTAAGARANLGTVGKYAADIGDGASTAIVVTHNLGTRDVIPRIRNNSAPYDYPDADYEATTINTLTVRFSVAPSANQYRVIIEG